MADAAGRLPDNIVYFGRALRRAGVPVGTAQILEALRAVQLVGFTKRQDFHTTLRAMIVTRPSICLYLIKSLQCSGAILISWKI